LLNNVEVNFIIMKKINSFWIIVLLGTLCTSLFSQNNVGISDVPIIPHQSSVLEIYSNSKGLLIPRLTTAQRLAIVNPADGLMVFDTDLSCFFYRANISQWLSLCDFPGPQGPTGPQGLQGPTGPTGPQGPAGPVGCGNTNYVIKSNGTSATCTSAPIFDNAGLVGIGTTSPNYKLHIHQDGTNFGQPGIQLTNSITGTGVNDGARLANEGLNFWVDNRSNGSLCFATNTFERARFLPDGKFGINIAAPVNQVDINGNLAVGLYTGNYTAPANGMIVSGNVRIGTPNAATLSPDQTDASHITLDVTGGFTRIGNFNSSAENTNPGKSFAFGVGALAVGMNWHSGTSNVDFWNTTANGQPTANLSHHRGFDWRRYNQLGLPELLMTLDGNGNLTIAGSNYNTSDKRIKSQIMPMEDGIINKIILLQPKTYYRNNPVFINNKIEIIQDKELKIKDFGFIAQDVYEIFPELVYKPDDENLELWAVDYSKLTVFLTKALQEEYIEIQKLKNELKVLLKRL